MTKTNPSHPADSLTDQPLASPSPSAEGASSAATGHPRRQPAHDPEASGATLPESAAAEGVEELRHDAEALRAEARKEAAVGPRKMPMADVMKFGGLIAFFAVMVVAVVLLWPLIGEIFTEGGIERVTRDVREAGPAGFLILLAVQFLQIVVAFIPGEVVQIAAGMIYGPWLGALIIFVGCVISSSFVFVLVHKLGMPFVQAMVPERAMGKFRAFERTGKLNVLVFILFLIPGLPKDVFTYLVPLTDMRLGTFVLLSNVGRLPGIVLSTYAAAGLVSGNYLESAVIFGITALVAIVALLAYSRVAKAMEAKHGTQKHDDKPH